MDKETRNAIQSATQKARRLLAEDFREQLEGVYDIHTDGTIAPTAGPHLSEREQRLRYRIVAAIEHKRASGMKADQAALDYLRDAAFTTLNRFVALKMLEARAIVQECITKGEVSSGFTEFSGLAPGIRLPDGSGYRLYLECVFDELSTEVKVLFDRRDPSAVLWPKRATFDELLAILNAPELAGVWSEDETIGWVYQFFNGQEERRKMRDESQAPRNSRELAVRNQFFTPRYVVQFLSDNTLGRIWYEMRGGDTRLRDLCAYMVRRPDETWAPRAKKDPRDMRVLDPACGSGHFLLYCFDLLIVMYEEAWADAASPVSEATGKTLREDYPEIGGLTAALPGMIMRHNLHGVDIDPRCAQIGQLALWMRAQRAFKDFGIGRAERPTITRANIVIAEPMPGEKDLLKEFLAELKENKLEGLIRRALEVPADRRIPVSKEMADSLAELVETVWDGMRLAGEMGMLLKIERDLARAIEKGRAEWEHDLPLFRVTKYGLGEVAAQTDYRVASGEEGDFWAKAEKLVFQALAEYAAAASGSGNARRRLFAEDATQGFALADLVTKAFDVVLMNPPFGEPTNSAKKYGSDHLAICDDDLGAAFMHAATTRWGRQAYVGAVSSSTLWFKHTLARWRQQVLVGDKSAIMLGAHLGGHVLDNASVGAAATVLGPANPDSSVLFFRCLKAEDKASILLKSVREQSLGLLQPPAFSVPIKEIREYRKSPLVYWISPSLRSKLSQFPALEGSGAEVRQGVACADDPRFVRAWWELPLNRVGIGQDWLPFAKSSEFSPFWDDITWIIRWTSDGAEVRAYPKSYPKNTQYFGRPGVTFPARAVLGFNPRAFPAGIGFGHMGSVAFPKATSADTLLGYLSSRPAEYILSFSNGSIQGRKGAYQNHYEVGQVGDLPWPEFTARLEKQVGQLGTSISCAAMLLLRNDETTHQYQPSRALRSAKTLDQLIEAELAKDDELVQVALSARAALDELVSDALGFLGEDVIAMQEEFEECDAPTDGPWCPVRPVLNDDMRRDTARALVSMAVGCVLGRFDIRRFAEDLPAPSPLTTFDVAPVTMLKTSATKAYPLEVPSSSMLAIDREDPDLADRLLGEALQHLWPHADPDAPSLLCDALGIKHLSSYLCDAGTSGFYTDHVRRYSKGRRRAPLYFWFGTTSGSFGVLMLAPAATADSLFILRTEILAPRLARAERAAEAARNQAYQDATEANRSFLAEIEALVSELREFATEVDRVIPLWAPHVDDGVVVNAAPFFRLIPHRESRSKAEATWTQLCDGDLDWARLAMRLWPERVVPKCAKDRSLAIAHDLADMFWYQDDDGKWKLREEPIRSIADLIAERTSSTVKAALKSLMEAPEQSSGARRGRGRR